VAPEFDVRLAVAHLHHGWRGAEADADLERVRALAAERDAPLYARRVDLSAAPGSREEAARDARLRFFAVAAARYEADAVALGHTADDQLETVLLHLTRGAGRRGLGGMRRRARIGELLVLRPLLDRRRSELRAYAASRSLPWGEDASNRDISLARNRLRHRLVKDLQQINPGAVDNVARAAGLLHEEEEWLDALAADAAASLRTDEPIPGAMALDRDKLAELPPPLQRRVVRHAIEALRGHCRGISYEHVDWVIDPHGGPARDLPGVRVRRESRRLRFLPLRDRRLAEPGRG
jgi:tRNA(Ile)-lysidine synthase